MVDFAFTEHEESLNDLTSLCRSQMIQRVIAPLLLQFHVRPERYAEFLRTHSAEILQIYESPEIPPAQWNDQLIEAMGASDLPAESKQQHLMNLQVSIRNNSSLRGTPQQWIRLMAELIEFCMPRGYDEWYQFAQLVFSVEELHADLLMITNAVHFALASSVEARHVAFDIHRLVDNNPVEAFARCMHWVTQFLAYTETAWPKTSEINEFGVSRRRRMEEENASQQAILATFLICDATYQGKLTSPTSPVR